MPNTILGCPEKPAVPRVRGAWVVSRVPDESQLTNSVRIEDEELGACIHDNGKNTGYLV